MSDKKEDRDAERFWMYVGLLSFFATLGLLIGGLGASATATAIIFATSIYGYTNRT